MYRQDFIQEMDLRLGAGHLTDDQLNALLDMAVETKLVDYTDSGYAYPRDDDPDDHTHDDDNNKWCQLLDQLLEAQFGDKNANTAQSIKNQNTRQR